MNAGFSEQAITEKTGKWQLSCQSFAGTEADELAAIAALCYKHDHSETGQAVYKQVCRRYPNAAGFFQNAGCRPVAYNEKTGLSGVNIDGSIIRKGSPDAVHCYFLALGHAFPDACILAERTSGGPGYRAEVLCKDGKVIGMVTLILEQAVISVNKKSGSVLTA
ncbi:hypothetical protein [Eubacterium sp. 1001713B170207_170306_E7]|uniref:hypothetical protein n=1 Tax=Eubacterium sp. 1001713B170207_170306_E7 TaxID=2787097 RepID=UPI00189C32FE|nr:hypothetical protein [Eubacterium sp. 1001713B170207_170306_E7]